MRDDWMIRNEAQLPLLRDRRDDEHELHPGERVADALARPAAERDVRELRQRRLEFGGPAIVVEAIRLREETRIAVHHPRAHEEDRARRREILADRIRVG